MHVKIEVMSFPVVLEIIGTLHSSMANYVGENQPIFFCFRNSVADYR